MTPQRGLLGLLGLGGLLLQVFLELVDRVELGDHLRQRSRRQPWAAREVFMALMGDDHLGLFALVLTLQQR